MAESDVASRAEVILRQAWPSHIPPDAYVRAVAVVLEVAGCKRKKPSHLRVGTLVGGLLEKHGPMEYAQLVKASGLSVGSVSNGLKQCGAVVVQQRSNGLAGQRGAKRINLYGLPGLHGQEVRNG